MLLNSNPTTAQRMLLMACKFRRPFVCVCVIDASHQMLLLRGTTRDEDGQESCCGRRREEAPDCHRQHGPMQTQEALPAHVASCSMASGEFFFVSGVSRNAKSIARWCGQESFV